MRNALVAILFVAATSHADPPRYQRPTHAPPAPAAPAAKPSAPTHVLPAAPVTAEQVMAIELAVEPIREEQEQLLGKLVSDTPDDDPDKPDYLFRLAERYAQQAYLWRLQATGLELSAKRLIR